MFYVTREEIIQAIILLGDQRCVYGGQDWLNRFCDCKYGGPDSKGYGSEESGCPELRVVEAILSNITDEEYESILSRPRKLPAEPEHPLLSRYSDFEYDYENLSVDAFFKKYIDIFEKYVPEYFLSQKIKDEAYTGNIQLTCALIDTYPLCRERFKAEVMEKNNNLI